MRKLSMVMTALFCAGATGLLWADDLNPQPLPPGVNSAGGNGGTQARKAGGENLTLHDQSQIQGNLQEGDNNVGLGKSGESKTKSHSSGGGAGKTKITGNSVKGPTSGNGGMQKHNNGKGDSKVQSHSSGGGAGKTKTTGNSVKGPTSGNGGMQKHKGKGDSKVQSYWGGGGGKTKITGNGLKKANTFQKQNGFSKTNGMAKDDWERGGTKPGLSGAGGNALPAVQSAH